MQHAPAQVKAIKFVSYAHAFLGVIIKGTHPCCVPLWCGWRDLNPQAFADGF